MGKLGAVLCVLGLLLLVPAILQARRILPLDTRPLVAEKYAGWTGVLSLWVYEGWPCGCGSLSPWLNRCVAGFEGAHPGVYIQPQFVDAGAIATFTESGILPPDMLLFPPGLLATAEALLPLTPSVRLRDALARCGEWHSSTYAVPVVMGGYLWAWNTALTDALPDTWRDTDAVLSVPEPQPWRRWDAALLALYSGRYAPSARGDSPAPSPSPVGEIALCLAGEETTAPTATPGPARTATLPRRLPEDFQYDGDAWRHFINGDSAAMPVTQREVRQLQALSEQGAAPQWQLKPGDHAFTDQLLGLAIVRRPDAIDRQSLCEEFLAWMLSDECQSDLGRVSAFGVTDIASGYGMADPLATLDALLRDPELCVPRFFDAGWPSRAETIVRKFTAGTEESSAFWPLFRNILSGNTND